MTCWELMTIIGVVSLVLLVAANLFGHRSFGMLDGPAMCLCFLSGAGLFAAILIPSIVYGSRAAGANACKAYHEQTGYETRFVVIGPAATGTCLAHISGRWIDNSKVQSFRIDQGSRP